MRIPSAAAVVSPLVALAACAAPASAPGSLQGYGEAHLVYVASEDGGRIASVAAREGDHVHAGQTLFTLDPARAALAADAAAAAATAAQSRADGAGGLAMAVRRAQAEAEVARLTLARTQALFDRGLAAQARLDADRAQSRAADAALAQARAERTSAGRDSRGAVASALLARRKVRDAAVPAPADGIVQTIFRRPGEVIAAGAPLASMIAPDGMRVRFFAPEKTLASLQPGRKVALACDGCKKGLTGRVSYVASEPQFTPPVIYSLEERAKLVFLVEAIPDDPDAIRPGLPVDVRILP